MNIQPQFQRTAAETALLETIASSRLQLPGDVSVQEKRQEAAAIIERGLPTRKVESWHYTDLRRLLSKVPSSEASTSATAEAVLFPGSTLLSVLNGTSVSGADIAGVSVAKLAAGLSSGTIVSNLTAVASDDAVGALNASLVSDGYVIDIPAGTEVSEPIELQNMQAGGQVHTRFIVKAGAGAKATIVERQIGSASALVSSVSELELEEGAEIQWLIIQDQPDDVQYLGQFKANLAKTAQLNLFIMNTGGKLVRQEALVNMNGERSEFHLRAVNLLAGDSHCDITMVLNHAAPHTDSTELVRNVVTDQAHGVFQGMIKVDRIAQKTDANMACNTLLLSDEAGFSTKPELEIFADDVLCGHGATVTDIVANHLYYLMARGIDEKTARGLLIKAFVAEVAEELDNEQLVEVLEDKLAEWFVNHS